MAHFISLLFINLLSFYYNCNDFIMFFMCLILHDIYFAQTLSNLLESALFVCLRELEAQLSTVY